MEIICTCTQAHALAGGYVGPERACDSATGVPKYGNHLHIHPVLCIGMGVWGLREPATVRQVCPYMEIICTCTQAHALAWGYMGLERACDSATGVPKYGNYLHIHLGPCFSMRVYRPSKNLRQCDRCAQIWKSFAYAYMYACMYICI